MAGTAHRAWGWGLGAAGWLWVAACGGQTVDPLDPRDATLPAETRQWIADAEDGVTVARARLQLMQEHLTAEEGRAEQMDDVAWSGGGAGAMGKAAGDLGQARVALAQTAVEHAEVSVELARAKYTLANAERAMLHDLARYDLQPLRDQADAIRAKLKAVGDRLDALRKTTDAATQRFWQAYGAYVQAGGKTSDYWETDLAASE